MAFTKEELEAYRDNSVPDLIGEDCRLLFVGINPGLWTAATRTHFCHPSNRFYPALSQAGLIGFTVDTAVGMTEAQRNEFTSKGFGITNLVNRATVRASELSAAELRAGGERLRDVVADLKPRVVAIAGVTAYRSAFSDTKALLGLQTLVLGAGEVWAVPNPSGLNAHETIDSLAEWYRRVSDRAGIT